jgi:hypothetical protein
VDVTGLIGFQARLIATANGPPEKGGSERPFTLVVVGGFERVEGARIGSVADTKVEPHLILMDSSGYLTDYSIDLVQIEAKP